MATTDECSHEQSDRRVFNSSRHCGNRVLGCTDVRGQSYGFAVIVIAVVHCSTEVVPIGLVGNQDTEVFCDGDRACCNDFISLLISRHPKGVVACGCWRPLEGAGLCGICQRGHAQSGHSRSLVVGIGAGKEVNRAIELIAVVRDRNIYVLCIRYVFIGRNRDGSRQTVCGTHSQRRNTIGIVCSGKVVDVRICAWIPCCCTILSADRNNLYCLVGIRLIIADRICHIIIANEITKVTCRK